MKGAEIACVMVPNFSVEVCLRDNSHLRNCPLALTENYQDSAEIIAVNQKAAHAGVTLHMTVAQAHILCPHLTVQIRDSAREIGQSSCLYKKLQHLSPFVEEAEPGLYYLDVSGFGLLYKSQQQFAQKILATAQSSGYSIKLGMAKNKLVARVAADISKPDQFIIVPLGDEKQFLHPLLSEHLGLCSEVREALRNLGLKTIGQVAALPANEVIRRFGQQGFALSKLARGENVDLFEPNLPTKTLSNSVWLTTSLYQLDMITAQVEKLLLSLLVALGRFNQGCSEIDVEFNLENKSKQTISLKMDHPTLSVKAFIRQLNVSLGKLRLASPVTGITVTLPTITNLMSDQLALDASLASQKNSCASLNNLSDNHTITVPILHDSFLPECRFSFISRTDQTHAALQGVQPLRYAFALRKVIGLRLVQPPRMLEVTTRHNHPVEFKDHGLCQSIVNCLGPWDLSGGWWNQDFDRLYYEIKAEKGQLYLIFYDKTSSHWFLQGIFD